MSLPLPNINPVHAVLLLYVISSFLFSLLFQGTDMDSSPIKKKNKKQSPSLDVMFLTSFYLVCLLPLKVRLLAGVAHPCCLHSFTSCLFLNFLRSGSTPCGRLPDLQRLPDSRTLLWTLGCCLLKSHFLKTLSSVASMSVLSPQVPLCSSQASSVAL